MLPSARRISLKRFRPWPSSPTTRMVHLSPTRDSTSLTARQPLGPCRVPGMPIVASCGFFLVIYLPSVSNRNHLSQIEGPMAKLKIAIVISTTRAARFGHKPAQWVQDIAAQRDDIETEIVDLRDLPMPFFDEVASNAWVPSQNPIAQRWQKKVAEFDGFIFVTAEYNHGIPAALKNALDYAYPQWVKKAAGFVGYGSVGGARAVEQLRLVAAELQMATIRTGVYVQGADFMAVWRDGKELKDITYLQAGVKDMLDQLVWWTKALKVARDQDQLAAAA